MGQDVYAAWDPLARVEAPHHPYIYLTRFKETHFRECLVLQDMFFKTHCTAVCLSQAVPFVNRDPAFLVGTWCAAQRQSTDQEKEGEENNIAPKLLLSPNALGSPCILDVKLH